MYTVIATVYTKHCVERIVYKQSLTYLPGGYTDNEKKNKIAEAFSFIFMFTFF